MGSENILGIDFGGSGIKGAPVDLENGELREERVRIETPGDSTPENILKVIKEIVSKFKKTSTLGLAFPALVQQGIVKSAANIDKSWVGLNAEDFLSKETGIKVSVINDADSAGVAEVAFGEGKEFKGSIMFLTIGTGIGTALFSNGILYPNTEIGHIIFKGCDAETFVSDAARKKEGLKWKHWAPRFNEYLLYMEKLYNPDMFIIGGGVSKKEHKFVKHLTIQTPIKMAQLRNNAGIIGAAMYAKKQQQQI